MGDPTALGTMGSLGTHMGAGQTPDLQVSVQTHLLTWGVKDCLEPPPPPNRKPIPAPPEERSAPEGESSCLCIEENFHLLEVIFSSRVNISGGSDPKQEESDDREE